MAIEIRESQFGIWKSYTLLDKDSGYCCKICEYGATLTEYSVTDNIGKRDILVPYRTPDDLIAGEGALNRILAPFSNRIENRMYIFNDAEYHLDRKSGYIHGFVGDKIFNSFISKCSENEVSVRFIWYHSGEDFPAFPFPFSLYVEYVFSGGTLKVTINAANTGDTPMPFYCGWHPYFAPGEGIVDDLLLHIPSKTIVNTNKELIPPVHDFELHIGDRHPHFYYSLTGFPEKSLDGIDINCCFTKLIKNDDNIFESKLFNTKTSETVSLVQQRGVIYVYTPPSLMGEKRKAIAVEPVETITNSINRSEIIKNFILNPGDDRSFTASVLHKKQNSKL